MGDIRARILKKGSTVSLYALPATPGAGYAVLRVAANRATLLKTNTTHDGSVRAVPLTGAGIRRALLELAEWMRGLE